MFLFFDFYCKGSPFAKIAPREINPLYGNCDWIYENGSKSNMYFSVFLIVFPMYAYVFPEYFIGISVIPHNIMKYMVLFMQ